MVGPDKPKVVVLGTETGPEDPPQMKILEYLKRLNSSIKVIFISEEKNPNSARIIASGADDIVGKGNLKPRELAKSIESVIMLSQDEPLVLEEQIICEIKDGKVLKVDDGRVDKVRETMTMFAETYDNHQKSTRHYAWMNTILTAYEAHFGTSILDAGCGTGHPMRRLIREVMVPQFKAKPYLREKTRILSLDSTLAMMIETQAGFRRLMEQHSHVLEGNLDMGFLLADLLSLTPEVAAEKGFERFDTILASYIIHWANDKEGTVRKFAELLPPGGKLMTIEEWNPMVTPGPFMPKDLAAKIEKTILPINRKYYYDMLRSHGFSDMNGGVMVVDIDAHHQMFGNVFQKV
jgi:ubiquinone/menaquinone biosynthesis C-methylase UbiE